MRTSVDTLLVVAAWVIAAWKFNAARQEWADRRVRCSWAFIFFVALGLTFQVDAVYTTVDILMGVPNLSWLLGDVAIFLALYSAASFAYAVSRTPSRFLTVILISTCGLELSVFLADISASAELPWSLHHLRTFPEYVLMETSSIYGLVMGSIMTLAFVRVFRSEQNTLSRLRWGLLSTASSTGTLLFLNDGVQTGLEYFGLASPVLIRHLYFVGVTTRWITNLVWPFVTLPNRVYLVLVRPFVFVSKLVKLIHLKKSWARIDLVVSSLYPAAAMTRYNSNLWRSLLNLDSHIYRMVIAILDAGRLLRLALRHPEIVGPSDISSRSSTNAVRDAMIVCGILEKAAGSDYEELVTTCMGLGRSLGKRPRALPRGN